MSNRDWSLLLFLALLWGGAYLFNGIAVQELPTFTVVTVRVGGGALTLLLALRLTGAKLPRDPVIWRAFFAMGLLNNVIPFSCIVWGQAHIASGVASILNATTPLFTVVVAHRLTSDEKLTPAKAFGVLIGMVGVAILVGGDAVGALGIGLAGQVACLAAALSYAFAAIFGRRFRKLGVTPLSGAAGQLSASTLILLPATLILDRPWTLPTPGVETWIALLGLATLATALAYHVYFKLLASAGATNAMLVTMLIPVSAIAFGAVFLGEAIGVNHLAGMALIGLGLAAIDGRPARAGRRWLQPAGRI